MAKARVKKHIKRAAGLFCLGLGTLGLFVPLLPTTIFYIIACWCFLTSYPRLARKMLRHRKMGKTLRRYLRHRIITRHAKCIISTALIIFCLASSILTFDDLKIVFLLIAVHVTVAIYIWRHPEAEPELKKAHAG